MAPRSPLTATQDRRRSTGEPHQALHSLLDGLDSLAAVLTIPAALSPEQARFEAAVFLSICKLGGQSRHPLGIVRVRPEADRLTLRLANDPQIVSYWVQFLLPYRCDDAPDPDSDPRDQITGVPGLRWQRESSGIRLARPGMPARILLCGFDARWWEDEATRLLACGYPLLQDQPDWTPLEQAAYAAGASSPLEPAWLLSPLLRRIRATAGPGPVNATDTWSTTGGFRLETTDGPPCPDLIHLLATGPTALGWEVEHKQCTCLCDHSHGGQGCNIDFRDPATGQYIYYSNGKWGRTGRRRDAGAATAQAALPR